MCPVQPEALFVGSLQIVTVVSVFWAVLFLSVRNFSLKKNSKRVEILFGNIVGIKRRFHSEN